MASPGWRRAAVHRPLLAGVAAAALTALLVPSPELPAAASGNPHLEVSSTVASAGLAPVLDIGLAPAAATAIPTDTLHYTATASNVGATVTLTGDLFAHATPDATATIASYFEDVASTDTGSCPAAGSNDGSDKAPWAALGGTEASSPGFQPVVTAPSTTGLRLQATPVAAEGVTYPASGDPILGTVIDRGATAHWRYTATLTLTPQQVTALLDPAETHRIRNQFHIEPAGNTGEGVEGTDNAELCNQLFAARPSGDVTDATITIELPAGAPAQFDSSSIPALADLAPGASVEVTATYLVPSPPAKGSSSDAAYLSELKALDGSSLDATASISGQSTAGTITATSNQDVTTEHVPILGITKSGPISAEPGSTATYQLALSNAGGATASGLAVTDAVAGGATGMVSGLPSALLPAGSATAQASYTIPSGQSPGPLADTASVTWQDANGNAYGPVSSTFATTITPPAVPAIVGEVASEALQGNFYAEPTGTSSFVATPSDTPAFGQQFPTIDFNPPPGVVNGEPPSGPSPGSRPFTDVTTDVVGNYAGTIVAQGEGVQAGVGTLENFDAVFTSSFIVSKPGDITFDIYSSDGFLLGVGNGATRVNGSYENAPSSNTSPFQNYPLVGAYDEPGGSGPGTYQVTVSFPRPGVYPYELDYFDCCGPQLSLTMTVATFNAQTSPLSVYVGYADGLRPAGSVFPFPWYGSPDVIFEGCAPGCTYDTGAIRLDNSGTTAMTVNSLSVSFGSNCTYAIWPSDLTLPPGDIMIFAQEANGASSGCASNGTFDTSDLPYAGFCGQNGIIPQVDVTIDGVEQSFTDTNQVLDTGGQDAAECGVGNESLAWQRIGGGGVPVDTPLPPAVTLTLTPGAGQTDIVGQAQQIGVAAMSGGGTPATGLAVQLSVFGANTQTQNGTTDSTGAVAYSYTGLDAGTDTVEATSLIGGLRAVSNSIPVTWDIPVPGGASSGGSPAEAPPSISGVLPPDGTVVTAPVPVTASLTPPTGQTITSWSVAYQSLSIPAPQTLASGTGTPPGTLATFDPTLLPNGTYTLTISATDSGGGTQAQTESLAVAGNLKLGRYVTTYDDLSLPVGGIPMSVQRTYDSTDKSVGDFGVGWHVSVSNFKVATNRAIGAGGWSEYPTQCYLGICIYSLKTSVPHYVTVTWPSGRQEIFDFTPSGGQALLYMDGTAAYTARPGTGTTSTLAPVPADAGFTYGFDGNLYGGSGVYDPTEFQLTTTSGQVLLLSTTAGLISETEPDGSSISIDSGGIHSSNGQSIVFDRDTQGRIVTISAPNGETLHYAYDAAGNLSSFTDADGNVTDYQYDSNHDLTGVTGSGSTPLETLTYDSSGRLASITDADGNTTQVTDNVAGRQQVIADANGKLTTVLTFDPLGDLLSSDEVAAGQNQVTSYTYDSAGHVLSATDPLGDTTTYTYDANGDLTSVTNPDGNRTTTTYNSLGEPLSVTGPSGEPLQSYTYDAGGDLTSVTVGGLYTDTITDNSQGQPVAIVNPSGDKTTLTYDSAGYLVSTTDPTGATTGYTVDANGNRLSTTDPEGNVTRYTYDANGGLTSITDPNGGTTSFTRDSLGRIVAETDPLGQTTAFTYDGNGDLTAIRSPDGSTTSYGYDVDGHIVSETLPDGTTNSYTYDAFGRLTGASNPTASDTMAYDAAGHLTSTTSSGPGQPTSLVSYTYDAAGQPLSVTGPGGTTTYSYSDLGLLASETDPAGGVFGFARNAAGQLLQMSRPNGVTDTYTYDANGDLLSLRSATASQVLQDLSYTYDGDGRRTSSTSATGTDTYTYDSDGRLTSETLPGGSTLPYAYDANGNPTETPSAPAGSLTYNADDELVSGYGSTYQYDASGDLVSSTPATGAATSYSWAVPGQLTGITAPSGQVSYGYDPLGRRVTSSGSSGTTASVWEGADLAAQVLPGAGTQTYLPGPGLNDTLALTQPGGATDYYLTDALGSTTALTDASGNAVSTYAYGPYGALSSTGSTDNPITFTGQQADTTGLYYMHDRYYDPATQRFLSPDPSPSTNPYSYVADDPTNLTDPTGADLVEEAITLQWVEAEAAYVQGLVNGISNYLVTCATAELTPGATSNLACSPDFLGTSILYSELQAAGDYGISQIEGAPVFQALGGAAFDGLAAAGLEGLDLAVMGQPLSASSINSAGLTGAQNSLETWGAGFALGQFGKLFPSSDLDLADVFSFVGGFTTGAALGAQGTAGQLPGG